MGGMVYTISPSLSYSCRMDDEIKILSGGDSHENIGF